MNRIAILGAGEVGAGWAALAAAHGRQVTLYDPDPGALEHGMASARDRLRRLVGERLADADTAARGAALLKPAASMAGAVRGCEWIIEAAPESLATKQAVLVAAEAAARDAHGGYPGPVLTSSSSGLHASALGAQLQHPERLLVVHPLVPVEIVPVVEVIPGPGTDRAVTDAVAAELRALGRAPIVLRREIAGNAVGRVAAAVWRECIDLVLEGVLDPADADRLVAEGPCLGWAAGGPHLTYEVAADGGLGGFLDHLLPTFESWWAALSRRTTLTREERARLAALVAAAYPRERGDLRSARDRRLVELVRALGAMERPA